MLVTAQRVVAPAGLVGINVYLYQHDSGQPWTPDDLDALEAHATLTRHHFQVDPGGNRVRSYLDVFAPEGTTAAELLPWFRRLTRTSSSPSFPLTDKEGPAVLRFNLDLGLVPTWRDEFTDLAADILLFLDE